MKARAPLLVLLLILAAACGSDDDDGAGTFACVDTECTVGAEFCMELADGSGQCASAEACGSEVDCECARAEAASNASCESATVCATLTIEEEVQLTLTCD